MNIKGTVFTVLTKRNLRCLNVSAKESKILREVHCTTCLQQIGLERGLEMPKLASCCLHWLAHPHTPGKEKELRKIPGNWMSAIMFAGTICTDQATAIHESCSRSSCNHRSMSKRQVMQMRWKQIQVDKNSVHRGSRVKI